MSSKLELENIVKAYKRVRDRNAKRLNEAMEKLNKARRELRAIQNRQD